MKCIKHPDCTVGICRECFDELERESRNREIWMEDQKSHIVSLQKTIKGLEQELERHNELIENIKDWATSIPLAQCNYERETYINAIIKQFEEGK